MFLLVLHLLFFMFPRLSVFFFNCYFLVVLCNIVVCYCCRFSCVHHLLFKPFRSLRFRLFLLFPNQQAFRFAIIFMSHTFDFIKIIAILLSFWLLLSFSLVADLRVYIPFHTLYCRLYIVFELFSRPIY